MTLERDEGGEGFFYANNLQRPKTSTRRSFDVE